MPVDPNLPINGSTTGATAGSINALSLQNTVSPITLPTNPNPTMLSAPLYVPPPPPNMAGILGDLEKSAGLEQKGTDVNTAHNAVTQEQANLDSIGAQIKGITDSGTQAQLQLESGAAGKDVTTQFLGNQQQEITRQTAIKVLPLQATALASQAKIASLQGNATAAQSLLTQAQTHVDSLFKVYSQDAQNQYQYQQDLAKSVYDQATETQKRQLDAKKIEDANAFTMKLEDLHNQRSLEMQKLQQQAGIDLENLRSQNDIKLEKVKAGLKPTTNPVINPSSVVNPLTNQPVDQSILDNLNLTNQLLSNPKLKNISGAVNQFLGGFFGKAATAKTQYDQLVSNLSLAKRSLLKGSGSISDYESKTLDKAATALKRGLSDTEFRKQLIQVKGAFQTATGGQATVTITDPITKQSKTGMANRDDINTAITSGYQVDYSE